MKDLVNGLRKCAQRAKEHGRLGDEIDFLDAVAEIERLRDECARSTGLAVGYLKEMEKMREDQMAISQTASGYLHEIERLRGAS